MFRNWAANGVLLAECTEDPARFSRDSLTEFDVVVFLNTTGNVLDNDQQLTLQRFVESGGGLVGIHAAADTEYDWPWYVAMLGAMFVSHPHVQQATIHVQDPKHPATTHMPPSWAHTDEWYNFSRDPTEVGAQVLITVDESTYEGGSMGTSHPIAWCRPVEHGRMFYSALGHTPECFADERVRKHILGAIRWAASHD